MFSAPEKIIECLSNFLPVNAVCIIIVTNQHAAAFKQWPPTLKIGCGSAIIMPRIDVKHARRYIFSFQKMKRIYAVQR